MKKLTILVFASVLIFPSLALAHPGRTDASGCHTCKTNCPNWGLSYREYHCHNSKGAPQPKEPVKSTYGNNGTGYVSPAPEYKTPKASVTKTKIQASAKTTEKNNWFSWLFGWGR